MKDFDITTREFLDPIGEPGSVRCSLKLFDYRTPADGWDNEKGEPIYFPKPPEEEAVEAEKREYFKYYRLMLMKHTKQASERKDLSDGLMQKVIESPRFDTRDVKAHQDALTEALGMAAVFSLDIKLA